MVSMEDCVIVLSGYIVIVQARSPVLRSRSATRSNNLQFGANDQDLL